MPDHDSYRHLESGPVPSPSNEPGELIDALCDEVPEFVPSYRRLAEACDDRPGEPLVLMELADFVTEHMAALETESSVLERTLATIESHIESISDDRIACEFVAFAFFDSFSPEHRQRLAMCTGHHSRALIEELELPGTAWESAH
jgi:hypothetical protein